jgi:hypothetical protein
VTEAHQFHYDTLGEWAAHYARAGFEVFPLNADKAPLSTNGMNDATSNPAIVAAWWKEHPDALIGCRVPADTVILDIDPRHNGHDTWQALQDSYGPLPDTRHHYSGRGDGGHHQWFIHPGGRLSIKPLNDWAKANGVGHEVGTTKKRWVSGIDILHHNHRYTILPPSPHPATGRPYWWGSKAKPAPMLEWLANYITDQRPPTPPQPTLRRVVDDNSIADWYTANHTWHDVLAPAFWHVVDGDGDGDGSAWRHPNASAAQSASIRHGLLFVYTDNTEFEPTEPSNPVGYTRFKAWALLEYAGDMKAAARAARIMRDGETTTAPSGDALRIPREAAVAASQALDDEFWTSRAYLAQIRQAAQSRGVAPFGLLGCTLAYIAAYTPPSTCLPPTIGGQVPLSMLVALYGTSGAGKSSLAAVAAEITALRDGKVIGPIQVGTGEGLVEIYHDFVDEKDTNGKTKSVKRQVKRGAILTLDEGGMLAEIASRKGATIMPVLRTAWSGGDPGQANASAETRRSLRAGSYTLGLISSWQDKAAQFLLADADGGTPQRFVWFSSNDPNAPDDEPDWPGRLEVNLPAAYDMGVPFRLAPEVVAELKETRRGVLRGTLDVNPLDAHRNLNKLKVAGCLAILDGRHREMTDDDWALAERVMRASDAIRDHVIRKAREADEARTVASAKKQALRDAIVADTATQRATMSGAKAAWRAATKATGGGSRAGRADITRAMKGADRKLITVDDAIAKAVELGWIEGDDRGGYSPGKARPT